MGSISFAILTVSDSCYANLKVDHSGPKLVEAVKEAFPNSVIHATETVPDSKNMITKFLIQWSGEMCDVILTTGGTGFSPRDVTPEATRAVIDREAPGLSYAMISRSLAITDMAMLSRAVCGIKFNTLIINLPGSVKGATECFGFIRTCIPHAVALLRGNHELISRVHEHVQNSNSTSPSKVKMNQVAFRKRDSSYPMYSVEDALALIFKICPRGDVTETITITKSLHRVLAEDIFSNEPLPPFNASTKDGYAVKTDDGIGIRTVRDAVAAGDKPLDSSLNSGEIVRINTGAPIPKGANAVVQVEDTALIEATPDGSKELLVEIKVAPIPFQDIRLTGSDIPANTLVIGVGDSITPGHIGVLATVGQTKLKVFRCASIGIISTGNELQAPNETLTPGHIRDSNKLALINLLKQYGYIAQDCGIAKDDPDSVKQAFEKTLAVHDVVVTTGGVSMGEFDVIKQVLHEDFGATIHFGRVDMKPGKPTTFATCKVHGKLKIVFGLPGNPVSAMVTSILFVIPAVRHFENRKNTIFPRISVELGIDVGLDPRPEYIRVHLESTPRPRNDLLKAYPVGHQISSRINSFIGASALLRLPSKLTHGAVCKAGEVLTAYLLEPLSIEYV